MTVSMDKKYVTRNGNWFAKVVYIHDIGESPVVVFAENRDSSEFNSFRTRLSGRISDVSPSVFDLIEVTEEKPALTLDDYYAAYEKSCNDYTKRCFSTPYGANKIALKEVLELAGVKV